MATIWAFLTDETNRAVLSWVGGAIVAVAGGVWAAFKFFAEKKLFTEKKDEGGPSLTVTATNGGVAAGGDMHNNKISIGHVGTKR
jgi:hypothetical protein